MCLTCCVAPLTNGKRVMRKGPQVAFKELFMSKMFPLALLAFALPVAAQAQEPAAITVQAQDFSYQKTMLSSKTYKLVGKMTDGRRFRLSVMGRRVSGEFAGWPVYFVMKPGSAAATTVLASLQ